MDSLEVDRKLWNLSMQAAASGLFDRAKEILPLIKNPGIKTRAIQAVDALEGSEKLEDYMLLFLHGDNTVWDDFKKAHPTAYKHFEKVMADHMAKLNKKKAPKKPKKKP